MKHILIILSVLLLSSPLLGDNHKGETLYRLGEYPDYKWMGFGEKDTHPLYKGQTENRKPNGLGILTEPDVSRNVGDWQDGLPNGQGTWTYPNGAKYKEVLKDGKMWNGKMYEKNGNIGI